MMRPALARPARAGIVARSVVALSLGLAALAACHAPSSTPPASPAPLAITNVTVIDGTGAPARAGLTVVIDRGRIAAIGPHATTAIPRGAQIVDGAGRFVVPGLWDMHIHLSKLRAPALVQLVAHGVTSVRDTGGDLDELLRWRAEIASGARLGPDIVMAGGYLETAANVERMLREQTVEPVRRARLPIADPAGAAREVARLAARGVDLIKFRTVASVEVYRAIAAAARAHGLPLAGHADQVPLDEMIAAGQRSVEHQLPLDGLSAGERAALFRRLAERGITVVPTLVVLFDSLLVPPADARAIVDGARPDPQRALVAAYTVLDWREQAGERPPELPDLVRTGIAKRLPALRELHRAGVAIAPGTDGGVLLIYPGHSLHRELALMVDQLGMSTMDVIVAATRRSAELAGRSRDTGTLEPGKLADLVLVDADPLADIRHLTRITAVVRAGRLLTRDELDRRLAELRSAPELQHNDWR